MAQEAFNLLYDEDFELHYLKNVPNDKMVYYYGSANIVLLSSFWEGSPNVIKEALACNLSIVSTVVGDVEWLLKGVDGCYIASFTIEDYHHKIKQAIHFSKTHKFTKGRDKVIALVIDSDSTAMSIINIYNTILFPK